MQSTFLLGCFALLSLSSWETADGVKTDIYGRRQLMDSLIYEDRVTQPSKLLLIAQEQREYPGRYSPKGMITCINVTEMAGEGGTAVIMKGGVGSTYVKLGFYSYHSFDFLVSIYGYNL